MKLHLLSALVADVMPLPPERRPDESSWAQPALFWGIAVAALALLLFLRRRASKSKR